MLPFTFTAPPLATVSTPGPPVEPPPTTRPRPPTFQVDPGPLTVTVAVPKMASISAPPWLFSTPPLAIATVPVPKMPMPVKPPTVRLEPAPDTSMLLATRRSASSCSVPPLITESVPPRTATPVAKPLTVSEPPLIVRPPAKQSHSVRSPPMVPMLPPLLAPVSVSVVPV
jgi:hypothetical protein